MDAKLRQLVAPVNLALLPLQDHSSSVLGTGTGRSSADDHLLLLERQKRVLDSLPLRCPRIPVICSLSGLAYSSVQEIKAHLLLATRHPLQAKVLQGRLVQQGCRLVILSDHCLGCQAAGCS